MMMILDFFERLENSLLRKFSWLTIFWKKHLIMMEYIYHYENLKRKQTNKCRPLLLSSFLRKPFGSPISFRNINIKISCSDMGTEILIEQYN